MCTRTRQLELTALKRSSESTRNDTAISGSLIPTLVAKEILEVQIRDSEYCCWNHLESREKQNGQERLSRDGQDAKIASGSSDEDNDSQQANCSLVSPLMYDPVKHYFVLP